MVLYSILILKPEEPQGFHGLGDFVLSVGEIIGKKLYAGGISFHVEVWDKGWDQVMEERGDKAL